MIHRIFSSLPSFKELEFHEGLNVLMARKETGATDRQTRNRAGKTSLIEIIHFLTAGKAGPESPFRSGPLNDETFGMEFDLGGARSSVRRSGHEIGKVQVEDFTGSNGAVRLSNADWNSRLGEVMFGLNINRDDDGRVPTFRALFSYFVRRQLSEGFSAPEKQAAQQRTAEQQISLLFLLGLDWKIASDWQKVRDQEKTLSELKKAAGEGTFGSVIGKAADLRTQLTLEESRLKNLQTQLLSFRVLPQYGDLQEEANELTRRLRALSNANSIDTASIAELERAMRDESPPSLTELDKIYSEAGIVLPALAVKRYDEVRSFHESVVRNRRDYLAGELDSAKERVLVRREEGERLDRRRGEVMEVLNSHGALEEFSALQGEAARLSSQVQSLRERFDFAEKMETTKNELEIERNRLALRLRRDFAEQHGRMNDAIIAFEETSARLYESAGRMTIEETTNGPVFKFPMQGSQSKGIKNMQIFCFDMMLMRLCAQRGIGPRFLVHDSHLFDGVDGRQVTQALKIGAETAAELGFQYIVTMNEDDANKETIEGFDLQKYILPVVLTDAKVDGGIFGIRI